jgi:hypothetical protein
MSKINIESYVFSHMGQESNDRTRKRLQELIDMGCEENGIASFGINGIFSGLYIEWVWEKTEEQWVDYINWVKSLILEKS